MECSHQRLLREGAQQASETDDTVTCVTLTTDTPIVHAWIMEPVFYFEHRHDKEREAEEKRRAEEQALRDAEPPIPEGRARGKLVYFKEGKYGFIRPNDGTKKEDNAFFALSELTPKNLATKLKIGDYLEYTPEEAEKPKARDVRRAPRPPKKKKKAKDDEEARAPSPPPAPAEPVSALEALALDVESRAPPKDGDEPADPGARPDRLLGYGRRSLNLKPKTKVGDDEPASYGPSKIAKGPDQGSKRERNSQLQRLISRPFSTRFG